MIAPICPLCGVPVAVPHAEPNTSLRCRKCHTTFHLNRAGESIVGDPPDVGAGVERKLLEIRRSLDPHRAIEGVRKRRGLVVAAVFLVVALCGYALLGSGKGLDRAAEDAAKALAAEDRSALRGIAASGTAEDVDRWFDETYPRLDRERRSWPAKPIIRVQAVHEERETRKGAADVVIQPGVASGLDVSLANAEAATAPAAQPMVLHLAWVKNWWGRWRLDGRETLARARKGY